MPLGGRARCTALIMAAGVPARMRTRVPVLVLKALASALACPCSLLAEDTREVNDEIKALLAVDSATVTPWWWGLLTLFKVAW